MTNGFAKLSKAAVGAAVTGALLSAAPAAAQSRHHGNDSIRAGEVIAGAVILGGLAAIIASGNRGHGYDARYDGRYGRGYDDRYDRRYDNRRHGGRYDDRRFGSRAAIGQCVRAAESRASNFGRAQVTEVRSVSRTRDGYRIRGNVVVRDGYRGRWGRGGYYDRGSFACDVSFGQIDRLRLSGLG